MVCWPQYRNHGPSQPNRVRTRYQPLNSSWTRGTHPIPKWHGRRVCIPNRWAVLSSLALVIDRRAMISLDMNATPERAHRGILSSGTWRYGKHDDSSGLNFETRLPRPVLRVAARGLGRRWCGWRFAQRASLIDLAIDATRPVQSLCSFFAVANPNADTESHARERVSRCDSLINRCRR